MKKKLLVISLSVILIALLIFSMNNGIAGEKKSSKKGYLGVSVESLTKRQMREMGAEFGALVFRIELYSPADEYGLMEDDIIQKVNDIKIRRPETLTRIIRKIKPGEKAKIDLVRDGKLKKIDVVIGKYKESHSLTYSLSGNGRNVFDIRKFSNVYLGVHLRNLDTDLAPYFGVKVDGGALVLEVEEDSPAEEAEFKAGDVIVSIDGEKVTQPEDAIEIISEFEEDDEVEVTIVRHKKTKKIKVVLDERKHNGNIFLSSPNIEKKFNIKSHNDLIKIYEDDVKDKKSKSNIEVKTIKKIKKKKGAV